MFSEAWIHHFINPMNCGRVQVPDGLGEAGDPACGDALEVTIRVERGMLAEVRWLVFGCAASIATSSMMSVLATGRSLAQGLALTEQEVVDALGGLPEEKIHCSNLGVGALQQAIHQYLEKSGV